jgi:DNA-binding winged helix-turn-helix (wHTH) protein
VLRRYSGSVQQTLTCGILTLDETTQQVMLDDQPIHLSQAQVALLAALMRHPNQILTREQLISPALSNDLDAFDRAIDTHIRRLRRLIHLHDFQPIRTVYGAGYKFVVPDVRCHYVGASWARSSSLLSSQSCSVPGLNTGRKEGSWTSSRPNSEPATLPAWRAGFMRPTRVVISWSQHSFGMAFSSTRPRSGKLKRQELTQAVSAIM